VTTYAADSTRAYREQSVLTATPGQLVVMLYDGCLRFLTQAAHAMRDGDKHQADRRLVRAEAIIDELLTTLDLEQGDVVASRLQGIYVFASLQLLEARRASDPALIDHVAELLGELRDAWSQIAST
jgi:flagellar secretion chaperone FliS